MNQVSFNTVTTMASRRPARRDVLRGLGGAGLGLAALVGSAVRALDAGAKKKRRKKRKTKQQPPVVNQFGCLDVGQPCLGDSSLCCSGVCAGEKPKKGKRDTRVCAAHNAGDCSVPRNYCDPGDPKVLSLCNPPSEYAFCLVTTGSAPFCGNLFGFDAAVHCQTCARDADCQALGFPPGSACVQLGGDCNACEATGNRGCFPPAGPA